MGNALRVHVHYIDNALHGAYNVLILLVTLEVSKMKTATVNINFRVDADLKKEAESLFSDLGINMTNAMTMFLKQAVRTQRIPFEISRVPNPETLAAMKEAELIAKDSSVKGYGNVEDLISDLNA